jgi:hypothetical protein
MMLAILFLAGAAAGTWFMGWRMGAEVIGAYVACQVGARNSDRFITSVRALKALAIKAEEKARALAAKGKK